MCGIAGFCIAPKDRGTFSAPMLAKNLLSEIQSRGTDATGAAWYEQDTLIVQKDAMRARDFIQFLDMPEDIHNAILHTRARTKGSERNNDNNHPIVTGNIVGVHNGGVWNDDSLFRRMGLEAERIAEVDTEAIFAAIAYGQEVHPEKGGPRLAKDLTSILKQIDGTAAIAWHEIEGDSDVLHLARIYGSPLAWGQTENGSFIFASTEHLLKSAIKESGIELTNIFEADEGTYMRVRAGVIETVESFEVWPPARSNYGYSGYYGGSSYSSKGTSSTSSSKSTGCSSPAVKTDPKTENTIKTVKAAIESFEKEVEAQNDFDPFLSHQVLRLHLSPVLSTVDLDKLDNDEYYEQYQLREEAIENFLQELTGDKNDALNQIEELYGFLRPGDWVVTDLGHLEGLQAQVYLLPQQFPYGGYILRVLVPNSRYDGGFEPVLVERRLDEFQIVVFESIDEAIAAADAKADANDGDTELDDLDQTNEDEVN